MKNKKELTPEQEAAEWLVKVRGYTALEALPANDLLKDHPTFVREVVKVMEGLGFMYCIDGRYEFSWMKDKGDGFVAFYNCEIIDHNWPLAAIKLAKKTPEIRKITEEYDAKH